MVMISKFRKMQLGLGTITAYAALSTIGLWSTEAANSGPDPVIVAGAGIVDLPKEVEPTPESMLGDYLAGNFALDSGKIADAVDYFQKALADDS